MEGQAQNQGLNMTNNDIVQKLSNVCEMLRDDSINYLLDQASDVAVCQDGA